MGTQVSSNQVFLNIPRKKLNDALEDIFKAQSKNNVLTFEGTILSEVFQKYYDSNIPVDFWWRDVVNDFIGPKILKSFYDSFTKDIKESFKKGKNACLAGKHGTGKTFTVSCILKRVVETGNYSALYVNLTDIIHVLLTGIPEVKVQARETLLNVDFLVIDEVDSRFMGSDNAADLFGRILEPIMRTRIQNHMPLIICTNTVKIQESFSGPLQASIESLMNVIKLIPIIGGEDARKKVGKGEL